MICSHCGVHFIPNSGTETCIICGYEQNPDHVQDVRIKKLLHDATGYNPQSDGGDKDYRAKRKWSMKD